MASQAALETQESCLERQQNGAKQRVRMVGMEGAVFLVGKMATNISQTNSFSPISYIVVLPPGVSVYNIICTCEGTNTALPRDWDCFKSKVVVMLSDRMGGEK